MDLVMLSRRHGALRRARGLVWAMDAVTTSPGRRPRRRRRAVRLLRRRDGRPEGSDADHDRSLVLLLRHAPRRRRMALSPGTCSASTRRPGASPARVLRPGGAPHLPPLAGRPRARSRRWTRVRARSVLLFCASASRSSTLLQRLQGTLPLNPADLRRRGRTRLQHGRELRDQHELAELRRRADDVVPHPDGRARGPELRRRRPSAWSPSRSIRGFARSASGTIGNFWADLVRGTIYVLLPISLVIAIVLVSQGVVQTFTARSTFRPWRAPIRRSRAAPPPARSRSSTSAPTAAASTTRTPAHPLESGTPLHRTPSSTGRCC